MNDVYQTQKKYWEGISKRRTPSHPAVLAFAQPKLGFIEKSIGRGLRMLEVGAGNGYLSQTFAQAYDLTALDFSENMLRLNPLPDAQKVCGDAEKMPFEDESFDVVFCANLLHHLADPRVAVGEMKRVASKHVVLLEPNILNPLMFAFGFLKAEERGSLKFTPDYLRSLGIDLNMSLRAFASQGAVVPNKTPTAGLPLLRRVDAEYPVPLGFYNIAIFDV